MTTSILSVENLITSFFSEGRWRPVVRDISFSLAAGETLAVVGESGSGKSVTSLSIMRLLDKATSRIEGEIKLEGRNLLALSDAEMRQVRGNDIAMIFQEPMTSLNPLFTIGDQICEALMCHEPISHEAAKTQALRLLDRVRIPSSASRFDEYPHSLSGGMRQRIMIAMALATKPKILIADEPTTALDVTIQGQILDLVKELQQEENMAVLFITHDMGVVAEIADRGVVMLRGEAVEVGKTADLFADAKHPYSRALLAAVPILGSMKPYDRPLKFPDLDAETGLPGEAVVSENTVDTQAAPILEVKNLVKRFNIHAGLMGRLQGRVHAIENVSFSLQPGETLSLVGESGCGKSTTARACMRLIEPDSGSVKLEGQEITTLQPKELRALRHKMQMVFQDPFASLNPRIRVADAIAEPYLEHGLGTKMQARQKVAELLHQVGLSGDMAKRFPHEFSGGQRQRICIARALALNPKVIVADESVSALDVSIKAQIINLLLELQASLKLAYLFISHDMAIVERVSHRVAVMYLGEIVEIGTRKEIFENPQHAYTKKLLDAVPVPDPGRRHIRRNMQVDELKSPIQPIDYRPLVRQYQQLSEHHFVQLSGNF